MERHLVSSNQPSGKVHLPAWTEPGQTRSELNFMTNNAPYSPTKQSPAGRLCAVTCYFNPGGFTSKRRNLELFSSRLRQAEIPLITVECSFDERPFELPERPDVFRVRTADVLWLKEHLLNFAIDRVPDCYDSVAWLDCDVLFSSNTWAAGAEAALREAHVVQLFERAIRLPPGAVAFQGVGDQLSGAAAVCSADPTRIRGDRTQHGHTGFAWAARRDFLRSVRLYEGCVIGGADHLMAHAFLGHWRSECVLQVLGSGAMFDHYQKWAEGAFGATQGRVGVVPGEVLHLWHGDPTNRRYLRREQELQSLAFDPLTDVDWSKSPPCWASHRRDLAEWAKAYFLLRKEDSLTPDPASATRFHF